MNDLIAAVRDGGNIGKGLFLMIVGMGFVFAVQVIFYFIIKAWPRGKKS